MNWNSDKPDERLPRYQQVHDDLLRRLVAGEWAPDQAIATEAELCVAYGVSIGTLRKSIDLLVAEGVLTRSQGKGTFVRRPRFDSSLFRFFRFKSKSGELVRPSAQILSRAIEQPEAVVRGALKLGPDDQAIHFSRIRLIDGQPVLMEEIWVPLALFKPLASLPIDEFGDLMYPLYEQRCQQVVARATETLTVEQATPAVAATLEVAPESPVILVHRVASDFGGRPIEWRSTRGAAASFQYQVEIR